jgi:hypothetical protein
MKQLHTQKGESERGALKEKCLETGDGSGHEPNSICCVQSCSAKVTTANSEKRLFKIIRKAATASTNGYRLTKSRLPYINM